MTSALAGPGADRRDRLPGGRARVAGLAGTPRGVFWLTFLSMLLIASGWVVGNPLIASVDEASHATKAAATVRGQLVPDTEGLASGSGAAEVPALFEKAVELQFCIAFQPDTPASCQPELDGDLAADSEVVTTAAAYNPLYYAVVGVPSLLPVGEHTLYLMRLAGAALAAALLATAVRTLAEVHRPHWLLYGMLAAVTPMVIYLSGSVNPQTTEVVGAIALWVILMTTLRYPDPALLTRRMARTAVVGVLFVNSRGISPVFLLLLLAAVVVAVPGPHVLATVRDRRSWPWIALAFVGSVVAALWILLAEALPTASRVMNPDLVGDRIVQLTLGQTSYYLQSMIGIFGWLDTQLPGWLYGLFTALIGVVVVLGVAVARPRVLLAMLGIAVVVVVMPVLVQYFQARYLGVVWQGRYMLPLAAGLPVLAGFAVHARSADLPLWLDRRALAWAASLLGGAHVAAYVVNLHRYMNGASGEWIGWSATSWLPPVHPSLLVGGQVLGWAAFVLVVLRAAEITGPTPVPGTDAPVAASR